jgi:hypothetical protein
MNIIIFDAAYLLYLHATFKQNTSLVMSNDLPKISTAITKYKLRGWRFLSDVLPHKCDSFNIGRSCSLQDNITWVVPLNTEGITLRKPMSPISPVFHNNPITHNTWVILRCEWLLMKYYFVRDYCLRYIYFVLTRNMSVSFADYFDQQALVEKCGIEKLSENMKKTVSIW